MPERGRSPGAKGTAYPSAQRPQKAVPRPAAGKAGATFNGPAGKKALPPEAPAGVAKLKGKTLSLPAKDAADQPPGDSLRSSQGDSLRSQKKPANAAGGDPSAATPRPAPAGKKPARPWEAKSSRPASPGSSSGPAKSFANSSPRPAAAQRPPPALRAPVDPTAPVRISKLLAERGLCSRREADAYIERGWVLVDGQPVTELGSKAAPDAVISLAPAAAQQQDSQMTLLLHKPVGYVSGQPEPGFQPAVVLIQPQNQARGPGDKAFEPRWMKNLAPAGRLDIDSTGLLVLTQDGRIARQLIGD
ncbi:MAG TPA: S4 domain-containing protein, partial [Rhodocyclaceae bacterium]|nr:S4 domain-containing protein [Rhodocyclaceae bacterium]